MNATKNLALTQSKNHFFSAPNATAYPQSRNQQTVKKQNPPSFHFYFSLQLSTFLFRPQPTSFSTTSLTTEKIKPGKPGLRPESPPPSPCTGTSRAATVTTMAMPFTGMQDISRKVVLLTGISVTLLSDPLSASIFPLIPVFLWWAVAMLVISLSVYFQISGSGLLKFFFFFVGFSLCLAKK